MKYLKKLWAGVLKAWHGNPVRITTGLAAIVVFIAAKAGYVLDQQDVLDSLVIVLPILLGGEVARSQVKPLRRPATTIEQDGTDQAASRKRAPEIGGFD